MKSTFFTALATLLVLPAAAQTLTKAFYSDVVTVSGEYEEEFVPDEFYLSIVIEERDSKGKIPLETRQQQMIAALEALNIDLSRLKIENLSSDYYRRNVNLATGCYELKLDKAEEAVAVQQALDQLGISQVWLKRVDRSDRQQLELQSLTAAQRNARQRAEALMSNEGRKVGKCFHCTDGSVVMNISQTGFNPGRIVAGISVSSTGMEEPEPLQFRNIKLTCKVTASFVLE